MCRLISAIILIIWLSHPVPTLAEASKVTVFSKFEDCGSCPEMIVIPSGRGVIGSTQAELGSRPTERPRHFIAIREAWAVSRFPVLRGQFEDFIRETEYRYGRGCWAERGGQWALFEDRSVVKPGFPQNDRHPAVCISWADAKAYVKWLSSKTGKKYRLLTEREREYVSRAGTRGAYWWGNTVRPELANYDKRDRKAVSEGIAESQYAPNTADRGANVPVGTVTVDTHPPNPWGVFQVHGNIGEWTEDCWKRNYRKNSGDASAIRDGDCARRVLRGGGWSYWPSDIRAAYREAAPMSDRYSHVGFRVARSIH